MIEISRDSKPGVLTGIDSVFYQNAYPVTAVAYGLHPIGGPDPAKFAPLRDGDLTCVAQRVVEHFEGVLRGQGLTPTRRQKIQWWEERVHESGATVDDVAELEKRAIVLRDIAGEDIYNSRKYQRGGNGVRVKVELIVHNGHAWSKYLHFPQSREVHFYESDVWHAIREATHGEPAVEALLVLPKRRRGQRQNRASDRALPPEKSPCLHPDPSSGQRDAGQGRPGPDLPQLLPLEWPDGVDA